MKPRRIGILGGMGPAATADFYQKLISETPACRDQDHLPVVIWADPGVPDRSEHLLGNGASPNAWLERGARGLVQAGCEVLVVPCNTAHAYVPQISRTVGIELISIIETTADLIVQNNLSKVGLLATSGTISSNLYTEALSDRGVSCIVPGCRDQDRVMRAIRAVKSGTGISGHADELKGVSQRLAERGAEVIVAACTELIFVLDAGTPDVPVLDPAQILARRVVEVA